MIDSKTYTPLILPFYLHNHREHFHAWSCCRIQSVTEWVKKLSVTRNRYPGPVGDKHQRGSHMGGGSTSTTALLSGFLCLTPFSPPFLWSGWWELIGLCFKQQQQQLFLSSIISDLPAWSHFALSTYMKGCFTLLFCSGREINFREEKKLAEDSLAGHV